MELVVEDLRFSYGSTPILKGVRIPRASPGEITAVIGPNAAGKTTLFKCLAGFLKPEGSIQLNGKEIRQFRQEDINRHVSFLPQENPVNAVLTVFEAVLLARKHSVSWKVSDEDLDIVALALEDMEIEDLALRYLNELSGGQKQLVSIAQALVRHPQVLLLDEPTSSLDLQRQLEVCDVIKRVTQEWDITTLIALHDLNLAARYADQFIVMNQGTVYACGGAVSVLTPAMIRDVYGVNAKVYASEDGTPRIDPISSIRNGAS